MTATAPTAGDEPPVMIFGHAEFIESVDEPPLSYDPADALAEVMSLIETTMLHATEPATARALGQPVQDRIRQLGKWLRGRATGMFRVTVIGEFKRGKSTLINALLGVEIAPSDVTPETLLISRYRWGEATSANLKFPDGGQRTLTPADMRRSELTEILKAFSTPANGIDITLPSGFVSDMLLVDTPGLTDADAATRRSIFEEVANSDLIIVVASAALQLSQSERSLLKALVKPHEFARILFVVNAIDAIEKEDDVLRLRNTMTAEAGKLFPGSRLHMVSAKDELALHLGGERPTHSRAVAHAAQFEALRSELMETIAEQKQAIRTDRLLASAHSVFGEIAGRAQMVQRQLEHQRDGLDQSIAAVDEAATASRAANAEKAQRLAARVAGLGEESAEWMRGFGMRVAETLPAQLAAVDPGDAERELAFYLLDITQSVLTLCLEGHQSALEELAGEIGMPGIDTTELGLADRARGPARITYSGPQAAPSAVVRQVVDQIAGAGVVFDLGMALAQQASSGVGDRDRVRFDGRRFAASLAGFATEIYGELGRQLTTRLAELAAAAEDAARESSEQARLLTEGDQSRIAAAADALDQFVAWVEQARTRVRSLREQRA